MELVVLPVCCSFPLGHTPPHLHALAMPPPPDASVCAADATSTDPWGPSHALMEELRAHTQSRHCADVLHVLHDALTARGPHWRRVLKALTIIAHCLRQGSAEVALFAAAHRALIRQLTRFEYTDAYRLDRGAAVRDEAQAVVDMLVQQQHPRTDDSRSSSSTYARHFAAREHAAAQQATSSTRSGTPRLRPHAPPPPHPVGNTTPLFVWSPWTALRAAPPTPREEPFHDSTTLAALTSHIEAANANNVADPDDLAWLNIYKLLFLLNAGLLAADDDTIRHWTRHTHLLQRLAAAALRAQSGSPTPSAPPVPPAATANAAAAADTVPSEVHRLAAELARTFDGAPGPKEVRRRARMF